VPAVDHSPANIAASTYDLLMYAGWGVILFCALMIVIPYLRGRSDLVTAWNFVLVGCACFIGVACLEAINPPDLIFARYVSFEFPDSEYKAALGRNLVFMSCLLLFYYVMPVGKKFGSRRFRNSPPWSPALFGAVLVVCGIMVSIAVMLMIVDIGFIREVFSNLGHKGAVFAVAISFYAWYRNRANLGVLLLFLLVFAGAVLYVMTVSHGRRLLLCVVFAPIAVMYWTKWRYASRPRVIAIGTLAISAVVFVGLWYQTFRFYNRGQHTERSFSATIQAASQVNWEGMQEQLYFWKQYVAQHSFQYGMMTRRLVEMGELQVHPLNTIKFVLSYPIPRRYWEDKPEPLGLLIVRDILKLPQKTNWGCGVAGQVYYEGDWYAVVIYAALLVVMVRVIDEPLNREPNNPFFIAMCANASLFLITLIRGDMGVHTNEVLECFLFVWLLRFCGALTCGTRAGAYQFDFGSALWAARGRMLRAS
jgi:hypothetical protein